MIGLIIVAIFAGYIILSIAVISVVYKKTKNIKKMFIALAIMILIPTWDVIIGYPIYKFLCWSNAGVKIYKTVDNVEGFYVGEKEQRHEPHEPYDGYKYLDYKENINNKFTGKYYRSYWLDSNSSEECIKPRYPDSPYDEYTKAFKSGKCIVKEEIAEGEVTDLWKVFKKNIQHYSILYLNISSITIEVIDPRTKEKYFTAQDYIVDESWIPTALNMGTITKGRRDCIGIANNRDNHINNFFIINTLKQKQGEN